MSDQHKLRIRHNDTATVVTEDGRILTSILHRREFQSFEYQCSIADPTYTMHASPVSLDNPTRGAKIFVEDSRLRAEDSKKILQSRRDFFFLHNQFTRRCEFIFAMISARSLIRQVCGSSNFGRGDVMVCNNSMCSQIGAPCDSQNYYPCFEFSCKLNAHNLNR